MKTSSIMLLLCACLFHTNLWADEAYYQRFMEYWQWKNDLPDKPSSAFLQFLDKEGPLSKKLRTRWLYHLAAEKQWVEYNQYYQPTADVQLQCLAARAKLELNQTELALESAKAIFLSPQSLPKACDVLFDALLHNDTLITQRLKLALEAKNISLSRYLLKRYQPPKTQALAVLNQIYRKPESIKQLESAPLHDLFYLYGLKRLVNQNIDTAIALWREGQRKKIISKAQEQSFLAHLALYKAMRNEDDAATWFAKVQKPYYNDLLLDWQIRYALKRQHWQAVKTLILALDDNKDLSWQYWLARAEEALGEKNAAQTRYQQLASNRNYYGFLASRRLNLPPSLQAENPNTNLKLLKPYQPLLNLIREYVHTQQKHKAASLIHDFVTELPKEEQSALAFWLAEELGWYGKSVYLCNNELLANQLALRFPLAYRRHIKQQTSPHQLPIALIYAMIRQESAFREDAISSAGARGLMQLMPATAKQLTKSNPLKLKHIKDLHHAKTNIAFGVAYLTRLSAEFGHNMVYMIAAYNAGPRQVRYWQKNHRIDSMDIWIETLPWHETRNYIKNVMAFYIVYQYRLHHKVPVDSLDLFVGTKNQDETSDPSNGQSSI